MERTTIYLDNLLKRHLLDLAAEESRKKGKRVGMAEMIRTAVTEYLKRRGKPVQDVVDRMLSTKGTLDETFEKNVKAVRKGFKKWKI